MTMTAPPGLDAAQRSKLERLIIRARMLLESDFAAQAEGRFGIHLDGTIEDEAALPDDPTDKITRCDLEQIVTHLRTLGEDPAGAVARLLREAAFTHVNRLIAIRDRRGDRAPSRVAGQGPSVAWLQGPRRDHADAGRRLSRLPAPLRRRARCRRARSLRPAQPASGT